MKAFYIREPAKKKETQSHVLFYWTKLKRDLRLAEPLKEMLSFLKVGIN